MVRRVPATGRCRRRGLLRHAPSFGHDLTGQCRDAHLQALQVGQRLDFLAEPAAHLHAGIAAGKLWMLYCLNNSRISLMPPPKYIPGIDLARGHAEGKGAVEGKRGFLANVVITEAVWPHFDSAVLHRIEHLPNRARAHRRQNLDLELAAGGFGHAVGSTSEAP
jgi:hypothetical protein